MDILDAIEKLACQARKEAPPAIDVRWAVMSRIHAEPRRRLGPLSLLAAGTALAASVVLSLGIHSWLAAPDPFIELVEPLQVITLW